MSVSVPKITGKAGAEIARLTPAEAAAWLDHATDEDKRVLRTNAKSDRFYEMLMGEIKKKAGRA